MDHMEDLQSFVADLKLSMEKAMNTLYGIEGDDKVLKDRLDAIEDRYRRDIGQIVTSIDWLKTELINVGESVHQLQSHRCQMDKRISSPFLNLGSIDRSIHGRVSIRRSRSADYDSGVHSGTGCVLTDNSSSPQSGRTSPSSHSAGKHNHKHSQLPFYTTPIKPNRPGHHEDSEEEENGQFPVSKKIETLKHCLSDDDEPEDDSDLEMKRITRLPKPKLIKKTNITKQEMVSDNEREEDSESDLDLETVVVVKDEQWDRGTAAKVEDPEKRMKGKLTESDHKARRDILADIVVSERAYCDRLLHIQADVYEPLKESGLITQKDLNALFPHELKLIYEQHCVLLHKLQNRLSSWSKSKDMSLAALFRPQFHSRSYLASVYTDYAESFCKITQAFKQNFMKDSNLIKFLKSRTLDGNLRVDDFLVLPLSRVSYYIFAFKKLLELPHSDAELEALSQLVENLEELAMDVNRSVRGGMGWNSAESMESQDEEDVSKNQHKETDVNPKPNISTEINRHCQSNLVKDEIKRKEISTVDDDARGQLKSLPTECGRAPAVKSHSTDLSMRAVPIPMVANSLEGKTERRQKQSASIRRGNRSEHWTGRGQAGMDNGQSTGPVRMESIKAAPADTGPGTRGNVKRGKRRSSTKRVSSIKQNLVAFFSKRKDSHHMDQHQRIDGQMDNRAFSSYTVWPDSPESGGFEPVASMESPDNGYMNGPARSSFRKGHNGHRTNGFNGRNDRVDGLARNGRTQKPHTRNYWPGKKKTPYLAHGNSVDVVEV